MKIICIGRNYADHAKELNNPVPSEPVIFMKPESAVLANRPFVIPAWSNDVHYEVEVLIRINRLGKTIDPKFAHKYYAEVGLGIDFTARDVQQRCKEKGNPWEKAKGFDGSAVLSKFIPLSELGFPEPAAETPPAELDFRLEVNGEIRQQGNTRDMLFSFPELISHVSTYMTVKMKDVIFTGTPAGVGPVKSGDVLEGFLMDRPMFRVKVR